MANISFISRLIGVMLRLRRRMTPTFEQQMARGESSSVAPSKAIASKITVSTRAINGQTVYTLAPKQNSGSLHIVYLHGGAYVQGFSNLHWNFLAALVTDLNCTVIAPDYPLAPRHTVDDAFAMLDPLYRELLVTIQPENLVVMGDSAGGGLTLALAQKLRDDGLPQPAHLTLLSPWLDVTLVNPEVAPLVKLDPMLEPASLKAAGLAWAGKRLPTDPLVSPIYGRLNGLAPISLFTGTHDLLFADCQKLQAQAAVQNIPIDYHQAEGMLHVWMLIPMPEAKLAVAQIKAGLPIPG